MKLSIKYMVSLRCILIVKELLQQMEIPFLSVKLGEVEITEKLTKNQRFILIKKLKKIGLELLEDKKAIIIERIKCVVVEMIHYADNLPKIKFSEYLSNNLKYDYTYMANLFSETEGITIEHYLLKHKIERVKELIIYDELNLTEIAHKMHYSSVSHLSRQFKSITGLTPTFFKSLKLHKRIFLDKI
jgi:AraC-like DNA-binding protein